MAPKVAGSNPVSHPNLTMGFDRQLDILMAILASLIVFVGCIFMGGISVKISLVISACVLLARLIFGRRVAEVVSEIF